MTSLYRLHAKRGGASSAAASWKRAQRSAWNRAQRSAWKCAQRSAWKSTQRSGFAWRRTQRSGRVAERVFYFISIQGDFRIIGQMVAPAVPRTMHGTELRCQLPPIAHCHVLGPRSAPRLLREKKVCIRK